MLSFLYGVVVFVVIPIILVALFGLSVLLCIVEHDGDRKLSAIAGCLAGLVLFAVYVVSADPPSADSITPAAASFGWTSAILGLVFGFASLFILNLALPSRLVGLLTLFLSGASTMALFGYVFYSPIRDITVIFTLSTLFGALLSIIFFPKVLEF